MLKNIHMLSGNSEVSVRYRSSLLCDLKGLIKAGPCEAVNSSGRLLGRCSPPLVHCSSSLVLKRKRGTEQKKEVDEEENSMLERLHSRLPLSGAPFPSFQTQSAGRG